MGAGWPVICHAALVEVTAHAQQRFRTPTYTKTARQCRLG